MDIDIRVFLHEILNIFLHDFFFNVKGHRQLPGNAVRLPCLYDNLPTLTCQNTGYQYYD